MSRPLRKLHGRVATDLYLSYAYHARGEYRQAVEVLRQDVARLTGALTHESVGLAALPPVATRVSMVYNLTELGEFAEGISLGSEALQIAEVAGQPFSLTQAYRGLGGVYLQQGRLDDAIPLLEHCLALCREADLPLAFPMAASYLGTAYSPAGRLGEALPLLEQALGRGTTIRLGDRQTLRMILLGMGYLHDGRPQDALPLTQEALALTRKRQERGIEGYALHLLGDLAARGIPPDVAQAETCYQQAMSLANDLGMRPLLAHSALGLGTLYRHTGEMAQAHAILSTAITLYDGMEMTRWIGTGTDRPEPASRLRNRVYGGERAAHDPCRIARRLPRLCPAAPSRPGVGTPGVAAGLYHQSRL